MIIGKLIPAATGLKRYRGIEIKPAEKIPAGRVHAAGDRGRAARGARGDRHRRRQRARPRFARDRLRRPARRRGDVQPRGRRGRGDPRGRHAARRLSKGAVTLLSRRSPEGRGDAAPPAFLLHNCVSGLEEAHSPSLLFCCRRGAFLPAHAAAADACGATAAPTNWIDFGSTGSDAHSSRGPGRSSRSPPGTSPRWSDSSGAVTIYCDMYLTSCASACRQSHPTPDRDRHRANRLFEYAAQQSSCSTPWIAENELSGAGLETPWSTTNAQYRDNVLVYLKTLAARGARPFLLVSSAPYTGRRGRRLVAAGRGRRGHRPRDVLQRQEAPRAGARARQPDAPPGAADRRRPFPRDRDSARRGSA